MLLLRTCREGGNKGPSPVARAFFEEKNLKVLMLMNFPLLNKHNQKYASALQR